MPAELIRRGGASSVLPADRIAGQLIQWLCPSPDTNHVDTEPIMPLNKSTGMSSAGIPEVARATALASLQAADPALRRSAAQTLAGQPEAVPVILDALERESSLAVRTALLDSLAATPGDEAVQALAGCLRSEDAWLRNAAIDLLRGMPEQVAPVIAPC
jgi:HEAT repeat protein